MPELEQRFGCEVSHLSGVTALIYDVGDHFAAHSDGGGDDEAPDEVRRRRVSLVVALNDGAGDTADFRGGELEFYAGTVPAIAARTAPIMSRPKLARAADRVRLVDGPPRRAGRRRAALLAGAVGAGAGACRRTVVLRSDRRAMSRRRPCCQA